MKNIYESPELEIIEISTCEDILVQSANEAEMSSYDLSDESAWK